MPRRILNGGQYYRGRIGDIDDPCVQKVENADYIKLQMPEGEDVIKRSVDPLL
jgi:hypothetical protein